MTLPRGLNHNPRCNRRHGLSIVLTLLAIEFLDEFVYGAREAAWPLIRTDLGLTYVQVGVLLSAPNLISGVIEPFLGILGDVWRRRALILGGGALFAVALALTAASRGFWPLLFSFILMYPSSGAFVTLSQATLMDLDPTRHEQNMARWTLVGSLGVVAGPVVLSVAAASASGWRGSFLAFAALAAAILVLTWRTLSHTSRLAFSDTLNWHAFRDGVSGALQALRRGEVLRWLTLLQFSDLMMDVLLGFLALYFVDVVGATPAQAAMAVAVRSGVGLAGDLLVIPLLERVRGLRYVRCSALAAGLLFPAFLLVPGFWSKLLMLALLTLSTSGWYAILQGQLYTVMPGQSGTVMTMGGLSLLVFSLLPLGLGAVAEQVDLRAALWLLMLGPVALVVGLPRRSGEKIE